MHIVHRDLKPANFLWSPSQGRYILSDFGESAAIWEYFGSKTLTTKCGTEMFMSPEMNSLNFREHGYVDLYYNDLFGFTESFREIRRELKLLNRIESLKFELKNVKTKSRSDRLSYEYFRLLYFVTSIDQHPFNLI
jgi:serine/threonine protein kinase